MISIKSPHKDIAVSSEALTRECMGRGRSGSVFKFKLDSKDVAIKLYDIHRTGVYERMHRELQMYERLAAYQGQFIPTIEGTVMIDGEVMGICMTCLKLLPYRLSHWTTQDKYRAKGVLLRLADAGLFHDDIKTDNFGVTLDNRMMVFDFEDVTCAEDLPEELDVGKFTTRYKKRICRMFKDK